ncbi:MAG: carboxypeptidase regulatory-like domain-containing protein [Bradymonadaceae bacterium]
MRDRFYIALITVGVLIGGFIVWSYERKLDGLAQPVEKVSPDVSTFETLVFLNEDSSETAASEHENVIQGEDTPPVVEVQASDPPDSQPGWVMLVDRGGRPVKAHVLLGAPGMWPFEALESDTRGWVRLAPEEVLTFANQPVSRYEILARSSDREEPVSFWGEVDIPEKGAPPVVRLVPSKGLAIRVENGDGDPVPGTLIRLARSSVGLLSLTVTTDDEGRASFTRLVPESYTLALNAEGYRRTEESVVHESGDEIVVTLEEGRGSRTFEGWRGPPGMAPPKGGSSAASTEERAQRAEEPDESDESKPDAARVAIKVYATDAYGGPIVGAWVELWDGERLISSGLTQGSRPLMMDVAAPFDGEILGIHPGWGEGSMRASVGVGDGEPEVVLRLEDPLFSHSIGLGRLDDIEDIEDLLGAPLVQDGQSWLIDATDPESAAIRAGVLRGDSLMSIRRAGRRYEVIFARGERIEKIALR